MYVILASADVSSVHKCVTVSGLQGFNALVSVPSSEASFFPPKYASIVATDASTAAPNDHLSLFAMRRMSAYYDRIFI